MGTYKRPLPEGVACEDSRLEFNPKLGGVKTVELEVAEKLAKPVKPAKPAKEEVAEVEVTTKAFEAVELEAVEGME